VNKRREFIKGIAAAAGATALGPLASGSALPLACSNVPTVGAFYVARHWDYSRGWWGVVRPLVAANHSERMGGA